MSDPSLRPQASSLKPAARASEVTLLYAVTPTVPYVRYAAASIYSALRANPGVRIHLHESDNVPVHPVTGQPYPEALHVKALWGLGAGWSLSLPGWCILMDADTWVHGDLRDLLPGEKDDISLRPANAWRTHQIDRNAWWAICDHFELPHRKVWANGVIACRGEIAVKLGLALATWMDVIPTCGLPYPVHLKGRPEWWMLDQLALAAVVSGQGWNVRELGPEHFSWNYAGEKDGIVHHLGKHDNPFNPKRWERRFR